MNQAVYHELLEEARSALLLGLPGHDKRAYVMARVEIDYRRELAMGERFVDIELSVEAVGRSSLTVGHRIFRGDGELAAEGRAVMVAWDPEGRRSRPLSEEERGALVEMQAAGSAPAASI